jgi:prepilin-type N-terminal cleavage/methylation domain-containing protein
MKKNNYGFSLVELLVVITILAIISVVAYQNFG